MQRSATTIGSMVGERYVMVAPIATTPEREEWDAVDTRLHRPVIVSWAPPRPAPGPDETIDPAPEEHGHGTARPVVEGDDATVALPILGADARHVLDGGVQGNRAYLVLEVGQEHGHEGTTTSLAQPGRAPRFDPAAAGSDDTLVGGVGWATGSWADAAHDDEPAGGSPATAVTAPAPVIETDDQRIARLGAGTAPGAPESAPVIDPDPTEVLDATAPVAATRDQPWRATATTATTATATGNRSVDGAPRVGAPPTSPVPRGRHRVGPLVLGAIGLAALLLVVALVLFSRRTTTELVPDPPADGGVVSTTATPSTVPAPTTSITTPSTTRPAPRASTTAATTTSTAEAPTTTQAEAPTTEPTPPSTAGPTVPPTTAAPTTVAPTTVVPLPTLPVPGAPGPAPRDGSTPDPRP